MPLYIGLVHYPVYNRNFQRIASAITTLDLHDIARAGRTFGVKCFYVVTPLEDQQSLAGSVLKHWTEGYGSRYNPKRKEAIELVEVLPSIEAAVKEIERKEGAGPILIATDASRQENMVSYQEVRSILGGENIVFLLFGTAWGLDSDVLNQADYILEPIVGSTGYNHLSVRTAVAIILDRLAGRCY